MKTNLEVGQVVRREEDHGRIQRGIVTHVYKAGDRQQHVMAAVGDHVIRTGAGTQSIGNINNWEVVPEPEWTREERVRHVLLTFEPSNVPEDERSDIDMIEFYLLTALLPDSEVQDLSNHDWPQWPDEWFLAVAKRLDEWFEGLIELLRNIDDLTTMKEEVERWVPKTRMPKSS